MLAITTPVGEALRRGCAAWQLYLDKFSFTRDGETTAKSDALRAACAYYAGSLGQLSQVCRVRLALIDSLKRQHGDRFKIVELVLQSNLLVQLGRASVLENVGLCVDRTTGLPWIPGTAVKGVISTWACWDANQSPNGSFNQNDSFDELRDRFPSTLARQIFGDNSTGGSTHAGDIIFLGGFPTTVPSLGRDIVNPHHDAEGRHKQNLTPNAFLCVQPGTKWLFPFFARPGTQEAPRLLETTAVWLVEVLTQLGIGAKTAAGYGRFRLPSAADIQKEERLAKALLRAEAEAIEKAKADAEKRAKSDAAHNALQADFPNDAVYRNRVLNKASNRGQWPELKNEIEKLSKPENAAWLERFLKDTSDARFRELRKQPWYPKCTS